MGIIFPHNLQKAFSISIFAKCLIKCYVPILSPMRKASIFEHCYLLYLFYNILEKPRTHWVSASVICEVKVNPIFLLPQVSGGGCDVAHEDAIVELETTKCHGLQLGKFLDVLDETFHHFQVNANGGLVEELSFDQGVPRACGYSKLLVAV